MDDDRPLVILDLDNTCLCAIPYKDKDTVLNQDKYTYHDLETIFRIYERPGLQTFLDILFNNYKVGIWTAASIAYAIFVIKKCIIAGRPERTLEFVLWDKHCKYSERKSLNKQTKHIELLESLYDKNKLVLIDDNIDVLRQKKHTINSNYFDVVVENAYKDTFLYHCPSILVQYFKSKKNRKYMLKAEIEKLLKNNTIV